MAQLVKNPPAVQETWVQSLGWEDTLEEGMATHSSILAWGILMDRGAWWATVHGVTRSQTWLSDSAQHNIYITIFHLSIWIPMLTLTPHCDNETHSKETVVHAFQRNCIRISLVYISESILWNVFTY